MRPEPLWAIADVADYLGVAERTVRTWQYSHRLPHLKIGGTVRFRPADVVAWVEQYAIDAGVSNARSGTAATWR